MYEKYTLLKKEALPQGGLLWNLASAFEKIDKDFKCFIYKDDKSENLRIDLDIEDDDIYISYTFDGYGRELLSYYMSGKNHK